MTLTALPLRRTQFGHTSFRLSAMAGPRRGRLTPQPQADQGKHTV